MEMAFPALVPGLPMLLFTGGFTSSSDTGQFLWNALGIAPDTLVTNGTYFNDTTTATAPNGIYNSWMFLYAQTPFNNGALYINCDYYPNTGLPLTGVNIGIAPLADGGGVLDSRTWLHFPQENTVMTGYYGNFYNVPIGHQAKAVSIVIDNDGHLFYGIIDLTIETNGEYQVQLEPVTEDELHDAIEGF